MQAPRWLLARRTPGLVAVLCLSLVTTGAAPVRRASSSGQVAGTVRDGSGAPIVRAQVLVVGTALSTLTDAAGAYRLSAVPLGPITVRAIHRGFAFAELAGTVRAGGTLTLNFTLLPTRKKEDELAKVRESESRAPAPADARKDGLQAIGRGAQLSGAAATNVAPYPASEPWRWQQEPGNTEAYNAVNENRFLAASSNPLSTFSIDVDAASYSNVRRFLSQGTPPPKDAVRLEELVNYFPYRYPDRSGAHPFAVTTEVAPCPGRRSTGWCASASRPAGCRPATCRPATWSSSSTCRARWSRPTSCRWYSRRSERWCASSGREDRVAIVVYAGAAGLVLPPTSGPDKATILEAIDRLQAGGSTAGGAGIRLAYDVAREHFIAEGNNRVILATDGDFNVGVSSDAELVRLIEQRREEGTFLTVLGFGTGNLKDSKMEQLADKGNGHYAYIDSFREAQKVFVQEFGGTLFTVAKDVKIQVEFNPARVQSYRLLGYENRLLAKEDFKDDRKDAGELGVGPLGDGAVRGRAGGSHPGGAGRRQPHLPAGLAPAGRAAQRRAAHGPAAVQGPQGLDQPPARSAGGRPERRGVGGHALRVGRGRVRAAAPRLGAPGAGELGPGADAWRAARGERTSRVTAGSSSEWSRPRGRCRPGRG